MAHLHPKNLVLCLGDILRTGDLLRSAGRCMPGQGPREGKSAIFPTAVLSPPIDKEAECTWYIAHLKPASAINLGVATMGVHAIPLAEDWASAGKEGRVWYVILRGAEGEKAGGGSFMDGGRVVSSSSALFAGKGTLVTLRWSNQVMQVYLNGDLVGSIHTEMQTPKSPTGERTTHALRFVVQFWNDDDQILLKSHSLESDKAVPDSETGSPLRQTKPASQGSGGEGARGAKRPGISGAGTARRETEAPHSKKFFSWGCCFACECPKRASWNTAWNAQRQEYFNPPPLVPLCGCDDCAVTSVLRHEGAKLQQKRQSTMSLTNWPRKVPSPPRTPDLSKILRMTSRSRASSRSGSRLSTRSDSPQDEHEGARRPPPGAKPDNVRRNGRHSALSATSSTAASVSSTGSSSSSAVGTRAGGRHERNKKKHLKGDALFVEYLGVKYPVASYVLEGKSRGWMLVRSLEVHSRQLLKDMNK